MENRRKPGFSSGLASFDPDHIFMIMNILGSGHLREEVSP
jgi:hypothetical protein